MRQPVVGDLRVERIDPILDLRDRHLQREDNRRKPLSPCLCRGVDEEDRLAHLGKGSDSSQFAGEQAVGVLIQGRDAQCHPHSPVLFPQAIPLTAILNGVSHVHPVESGSHRL